VQIFGKKGAYIAFKTIMNTLKNWNVMVLISAISFPVQGVAAGGS